MNPRRRNLFAVSVAIALVVGVVGGWIASRSSSDGVDANLSASTTQPASIATNAQNVGKAFPFVAVSDLTTNKTTMLGVNGTPMVVNFWFSTCAPCRREMPLLAAAAAAHKDVVDFVGINPNDPAASAENFLNDYKVGYPNFLDHNGDQVAAAGVGTFPATFFLDAHGNIVQMHAGELSADDLAKGLAALGVKS